MIGEHPLTTDAVDGPASRGGGDPGAGSVGDAVRRPMFEGGQECVLNGFLRGVEVTAEGCDETVRF